MEDIKNKNAYRILVYESIKAFLIMFVVLIFIGWLINDTIDITNSALFALLITGGVMIALVTALKIMTPSFRKKTREERINAFKKNRIAKKLIATITIIIALFLIIIWLIVPLVGFTFWQVLVASLGIGLMGSLICTVAAWYITQIEKPPFQNWNSN